MARGRGLGGKFVRLPGNGEGMSDESGASVVVPEAVVSYGPPVGRVPRPGDIVLILGFSLPLPALVLRVLSEGEPESSLDLGVCGYRYSVELGVAAEARTGGEGKRWSWPP
mgnify:CR=1 FL=1